MDSNSNLASSNLAGADQQVADGSSKRAPDVGIEAASAHLQDKHYRFGTAQAAIANVDSQSDTGNLQVAPPSNLPPTPSAPPAPTPIIPTPTPSPS